MNRIARRGVGCRLAGLRVVTQGACDGRAAWISSGARVAYGSNGDGNRMNNQVANTEGEERCDDGSERTAVQRLLRLAEGVRLFRADDGRLFARVPVGHRVEVYGLRSGAFRDWLIGGHFQEFGALPPEGAIRRVIGALEAFVRFGSGAPQVFIRVGGNSEEQGAGYYIDLGDVTGHAIHIGAGGWNVVERPGVEFRRPDGLLPMPRPVREGSIELLRPYVNLSPSGFSPGGLVA